MNKPTPPPPEFQQPEYIEEETITLVDILLIPARHIKIIIIIPFILSFFMFIHLKYFAVSEYESSSKIMSSSGGSRVSPAAGLAAQFGINLQTGDSEPQWVYKDIIKSRTIAHKMLNRKFDTSKFGPQKPLIQILTYGNQKPQVGMDTLKIIAVKKLLGMIQISENKSTGIHTLTLTTNEPKFSFDLNSAIISVLDVHQKNYNKAKTSDTRKFIEERITSTEKQLQITEETLKDFRGRNRRIQNSPGLLLEQERLEREVSVLLGVYTTLKQQLETAKINEVKESDYVIVIDPPQVSLSPIRPQKISILFITGLSGIVLGIFFAFTMEYYSSQNKEEKDKMKVLKSLLVNNISEMIPFFAKKN